MTRPTSSISCATNCARPASPCSQPTTASRHLPSRARTRPDAVVLDLMLPEMSGEEVCRQLKGDPDTAAIPVLMLTAKGQPAERIAGLEIGADDYITKPFSPRELVLRVEAVLRRVRGAEKRREQEFIDEFVIDRGSFEINLQGRRLELTTTEFKLLCLLLERRGRTQSRETLLFDVWGYTNAMDTRTVDTHIRRLREKLGTPREAASKPSAARVIDSPPATAADVT